jgi:hypothetical protein
MEKKVPTFYCVHLQLSRFCPTITNPIAKPSKSAQPIQKSSNHEWLEAFFVSKYFPQKSLLS